MNQSLKDQIYMKEQPILPLLLSMAAPMAFSMLVNSLYNIVDSIFVAQISEEAMTALSLIFPIQNFVNSVAVGFGVGMNVLIAFCLGCGRTRNADQAASQGVFLSFLHGILLTAAGFLVLPSFLNLFTKDSETIALGLDYAHIILLFSLVITVEIAFEKYFQALGKMVISMISMASGCIFNMILDPILIFGLGPAPALGIRGAGIATGLGQCLSLLIYLFFYFFRPLSVRIRPSLFFPKKAIATRLYAVGIPAALNMALPSLMISALNEILSLVSESGIVILGIYYKLQTFLYLPANGLIQGMRPLIGYNYGAKEEKRVRKIFYYSLAITAVIMAIGTLLCMLIPDVFVKMFTSRPDTIANGSVALRTISCGFLVSAVSVVSCGALEGLGKGPSSLLVSLLRYLILIIPIAFVLSQWIGINGVWHAFWITEAITAVASYWIYRKAVLS